jgi:vitamin K-dependent gamma-carboxylase
MVTLPRRSTGVAAAGGARPRQPIGAPPFPRSALPGRAARALVERASRPVDGASLAVLRIAFGLVGVLVAVRTIANGWVEELYAGPRHHFTYAGFGWVHPPSVTGTYVLVAVLGLGAACVALGWRYRLALTVFLVAFVWLELIDVTTYLNHYWFVTLFAIVLLAVPAHACWSLDARSGRVRHATVPLGAIVLARAQVGVVYVFAGLAKLHTDWLLHGLPLRMWLPTHADLAIVGPWLVRPWVAIALSGTGALFDLLVVPALCYRRTRPFAWAAVVAFHLVTWRLFPMIGVFPWLMIAASTAFFAPDWPRRLASWARRAQHVPRPTRAPRDVPRSWSSPHSRGSRCRCSSRCAASRSRATRAGPTRATGSPGPCSPPRRADA